MHVLGPDDECVTSTLPANRCRNPQWCVGKLLQADDRISRCIYVAQGAVEGRHVPELVQATKVPAICVRVVGPNVRILVHLELLHECVIFSASPHYARIECVDTFEHNPLMN